MERCFRWKPKYRRLGLWNEQASVSYLLFQGTFSNIPYIFSYIKWFRTYRLKLSEWDYVWDFWKGINRIGFAQNVVIPIVVFIQIILLLRYFRIDRVLGTLLMTIKRFLIELIKLFVLLMILIIPYGLIQENLLYPNQYLTT